MTKIELIAKRLNESRNSKALSAIFKVEDMMTDSCDKAIKLISGIDEELDSEEVEDAQKSVDNMLAKIKELSKAAKKLTKVIDTGDVKETNESTIHHYTIDNLNEKIISDTHKHGESKVSFDDVLDELCPEAPWLSVSKAEKKSNGAICFTVAYKSEHDDEFIKLADSISKYDFALTTSENGPDKFTSHQGVYVGGDDDKDLSKACDHGNPSGYTFVDVAAKKAGEN